MIALVVAAGKQNVRRARDLNSGGSLRFLNGRSVRAAMAYRLDITARLHRRMLEIVGTGLPLITKSKYDADLVGLALLREEMVQVMDAYCHHVHQLRDSSGLPADRADALVDGCTYLRAAYDTFRSRWVHRDGIENWHEHRLSAVVMMKQVRTLVQQAEAARQVPDSRAA